MAFGFYRVGTFNVKRRYVFVNGLLGVYASQAVDLARFGSCCALKTFFDVV